MAAGISGGWYGSTAGGTSVSVSSTTTTATDETLLCFLSKDDDTATTVQPVGWIQILGFESNNAIYVEAWYRPKGVEEGPSTYTWEGDSEEYVAFMMKATGLSENFTFNTAIDASVTPQTPALSATGDTLAIVGYGVDGDSSPLTIDAAVTSVTPQQSSTGAGSVGQIWGYKHNTGNILAYNGTIASSDEWAAYTISCELLSTFTHTGTGGATVSGSGSPSRAFAVEPIFYTPDPEVVGTIYTEGGNEDSFITFFINEGPESPNNKYIVVFTKNNLEVVSSKDGKWSLLGKVAINSFAEVEVWTNNSPIVSTDNPEFEWSSEDRNSGTLIQFSDVIDYTDTVDFDISSPGTDTETTVVSPILTLTPGSDYFVYSGGISFGSGTVITLDSNLSVEVSEEIRESYHATGVTTEVGNIPAYSSNLDPAAYHAAFTSAVEFQKFYTGIIPSGSAVSSIIKSLTGSGGLIISGVADTALVAGGNNVYEVFPSGGGVLAGDATTEYIFGLISSGGVVTSGAATLNRTRVYVPSDGVAITGEAFTVYFPTPPYAELLTSTTKGNLVFSHQGSFIYDYTSTPGEYTPPAEHENAIDEDSFTYRVVDVIGTSYPTTVTIYINSVIKTFTVTGSGGPVISGVATTDALLLNIYQVIGSGNIFVFGNTETSPILNVIGVGGVVVSGQAFEIRYTRTTIMSGGISISGSAGTIQNRDWFFNGSGPVLLSGSSVSNYIGAETTTFSFTGIGGAHFSGNAITVKLDNNIHTPAGGPIISGVADESFIYSSVISGGPVISGTSTTNYAAGPVNTFSYTGSGSVELSGEALLNRIYSVEGEDGPVVDGSALLARTITAIQGGKITLSGTAVSEKLDTRFPFNYIDFDFVINRSKDVSIEINQTIAKDVVICANKYNDAIIQRSLDREIQIARELDDNVDQNDTIEIDFVISREIDNNIVISKKIDRQLSIATNKDLSIVINDDVNKEISIVRKIEHEVIM